MKNKSILDLMKKRRIYLDGGTGTCLQTMGLPAGTPPEAWNLQNPEAIRSLHEQYLDAGSDVIATNTFGVNSLKYENYAEYIRAAIKIAREAIGGRKDKFVAFDVGPTGRLLAPLGDLGFEEAVEVFYRSVAVARECGADLVLIETMNDSYETKAAVIGAREAAPELPIFVTNVYDGSGKLMTGASPEAMIAMLEGLGVSALGMNCSLGADKMLSLLPRFLENASVPVIIKPNAGLPEIRDGVTVFETDKESFAEAMKKMAELGALVMGGCCGTTPEYIKALVSATEGIPCKEITEKNICAVSSFTHAVKIGGSPVLIGERINPTGKPRFKEALRTGDLGYIMREALSEVEAGSHILDVNVGLPGIDEADMMRRVVYELQSVTDTPLQIDSSNPAALAAAMRIYNGKPLVNSVNAKKESMDAVLPLVKKYGGAIIALTLGEDGIPDSAEERVLLAERIIAEAKKYGIDRKNIIVDPLALAASSDKNAARVTLETIKMLAERGIRTSLGVSNVSFGLPSREKINSVFFAAALTNGLSAAIINPHSAPMIDTYRAYRALSGLDEGCAEFISAESAQGSASKASAPVAEEITLMYAIRRGLRKDAALLAERELSKCEPLEIINSAVIPALNDVGCAFESGKAYLPELLASAEAASAAFEVIKTKLPAKESSGRRVILATVKGDVHDIGKNIVRVLLESYGFSVTDLGRDVPPERILCEAKAQNCRLVGLSALMTTTVPAMQETIELIRQKMPECKVMVGGAVLTESYAEAIGADAYGKDAMDAVRIAEELLKK